jgi:hypothetical protein
LFVGEVNVIFFSFLVFSYYQDRYIQEEVNHKSLDNSGLDHLGGSWFEGMYEQIQKKPALAMDFAKMIGRPEMVDVVDEEDLMETLVGPSDKLLDLDVQDWLPHKANAKAIVFDDPKKYPRFPTMKPDEKAVDAPPTPEAKYTLIDERPPMVVDMSKMLGRQTVLEKAQEEEDLNVIVNGEIDSQYAIELGEERSRSIAKGIESSLRKAPFYVDFDKQLGRKVLEDQDRDDSNLIGEAIGAQGRLFTTIESVDLSMKKPQNGVSDWEKAVGREDSNPLELLNVENGDWLLNEKELDLFPNKEASSRYGQIQCF